MIYRFHDFTINDLKLDIVQNRMFIIIEKAFFKNKYLRQMLYMIVLMYGSDPEAVVPKTLWFCDIS